jgi:hypothetical protein
MVRTLAVRTFKVSDLDQAEGSDYGVVVRGYPGIDGAKLLDVTKEQADVLVGLAVKDAITIDVRNPDTSTNAVQVPVAAFNKWIGKPEVMQNAAHLKGRRPGYSPTNAG